MEEGECDWEFELAEFHNTFVEKGQRDIQEKPKGDVQTGWVGNVSEHYNWPQKKFWCKLPFDSKWGSATSVFFADARLLVD
jgi:hypothetical protein